MKLRLFAFACAMLPGAMALAQSDPMEMAQVAAANQLGVMEYCQSKGWADQPAVDAERASLSGLPPATQTGIVAAAEDTGKEGSLLNNGTAMPLRSMASQTNTSEQALCGKLADSAKLVAAQRSAAPAGFPAMPGGMPAMPNGMSMPSMPGMPKPQ